jgi:xanthine dehydrogenase iron-sulfur cluster and FAD-binding subunit A
MQLQLGKGLIRPTTVNVAITVHGHLCRCNRYCSVWDALQDALALKNSCLAAWQKFSQELGSAWHASARRCRNTAVHRARDYM